MTHFVSCAPVPAPAGGSWPCRPRQWRCPPRRAPRARARSPPRSAAAWAGRRPRGRWRPGPGRGGTSAPAPAPAASAGRVCPRQWHWHPHWWSLATSSQRILCHWDSWERVVLPLLLLPSQTGRLSYFDELMIFLYSPCLALEYLQYRVAFWSLPHTSFEYL